MDNVTADERRKVAARLRKTRGIMAFVEALGIDPDGDWCWTDVSRRVSDLIDPTCKNLTTRPADVLFCSECGEHVDIASVENADDYRARYCPNCGARVVRDDD